MFTVKNESDHRAFDTDNIATQSWTGSERHTDMARESLKKLVRLRLRNFVSWGRFFWRPYRI